MKREAAVIGNPISHSLSPSIFGFLAHRLGVADLNYRAIEVSSEELKDFVRQFGSNAAGVGFNVTIPHKESILPLLNEVSPEAQVIGAVNVVHRFQDRLKGYNTDVYGILHTLKKRSVSMQGKKALLIGAGGAARAVAYALGMEGASQVTLLSPNQERARALIAAMQPHFKGTVFQTVSDWSELKTDQWSLVAQTTPLGMNAHPRTREGVPASDYFSNLSRLSIESHAFAFDLIYRPEMTPFLEQAQKLGLKPIGGLDMLIEQALETWRIWFNEKPEANLAEYLRHRPIFLTGFMGAGKSTIGPLLARSLGWNFVETDQVIENEIGLSIPEIFRDKGESFFREIENKVIARHVFSSRTVVSLGGGALTHPATRELLQKTGRLVFLMADPKTLHERLKPQATHRPLLAGLSDEQRQSRIESLLKEREPFYNLATFKLDTASITPEQAAHKIRENFL